jgi:hypothetical protein
MTAEIAAMATVPHPHERTGDAGDLRIAIRRLILAGCHACASRHDRDATAFVAIPLAMVATGLLGVWWAWIPLVAAAAIAVPRWRWSALLTLQEAFVGTVWATVGVSYLREFPSDSVIIECLWAGFPVALATAGHRARVRASGSAEQ